MADTMSTGDWIIALLASMGVVVLLVVFVLVVRMVFFGNDRE